MQVTVAQLQACFLALPRVKAPGTDEIIFIILEPGQERFETDILNSVESPNEYWGLEENGLPYTTITFVWSDDLKTWTTDL